MEGGTGRVGVDGASYVGFFRERELRWRGRRLGEG